MQVSYLFVVTLSLVTAVSARLTTVNSTSMLNHSSNHRISIMNADLKVATIFEIETGVPDTLDASSVPSTIESSASKSPPGGTHLTTNEPPSATPHRSKHGNGCRTNCTFTKVESNHGNWQKCQTMATAVVGQVMLIVDGNTNMTTTTTSYLAQVTFTSNGTIVTSDVTDILANGSHVLTRTDVNAAGTVTVAIDGTIM